MTCFRSVASERVQGARLGHSTQSVGHVLIPDTPHPAPLPGHAHVQHTLPRRVPTGQPDAAAVVVSIFTHAHS